jgi:hypothetical protein
MLIVVVAIAGATFRWNTLLVRCANRGAASGAAAARVHLTLV